MDQCNLEVNPVRINISSSYEIGWSIHFYPEIHVCMAAVTRESACKESQNGKAKRRFL